jgi:hypothetical protein
MHPSLRHLIQLDAMSRTSPASQIVADFERSREPRNTDFSLRTVRVLTKQQPRSAISPPADIAETTPTSHKEQIHAETRQPPR